MKKEITIRSLQDWDRDFSKRKGGIVILPLKEYQKLCEEATPTYYLKGKKAKEIDKLVEQGLKEYRKGKCKAIKSLSDLD